MLKLSRRQLYWAVVSAVAAVVAILVTVVFFLFGHIREDIKNDTTITLSEGLEPIRTSIRESQGRIEKIDGELEVLLLLVASTIEGHLKKSSTLAPKEFEEHLSSLYQALTQAKLVGVKTEPKLISALATKLARADTSTPRYWPTTAEFVSYRSIFSAVPRAEAKSAQASARSPAGSGYRNTPISVCTETELHPAKVISVPSPTKFTFELPFFENCKLTLDDAAQQTQINRLLKSQAASGIAFKDSLVEYKGGEINIDLFQDAYDPNRKISSLVFINCTFDLTATERPSRNAEVILRDLLLNTSGDIAILPGHKLQVVPINPAPR